MSGRENTRRLDPLPPEHTPALKEQFDGFFNSLGFVPNSVLTMQRKPKLVQAFVAMQGAIWDPQSKVHRGVKRLIAHMAGRTSGDAYSMAHTASGALHFGVDERKLDAIVNYDTSPLFYAAERAALDLAVAANMAPAMPTDPSFAALHAHWSEEEIVEIVATIAMAAFLSRWNVIMATPLEAEPMEIGEIHLAKYGWAAGRHRP